MPTPLTLDGRSLSQTTRVADLRGTDLVPLVRPSEPLSADQNVSIRADRLQALLGTGAVAAPPGVTLYDKLGIHTDGAATQRLVNEVADAAVRVPNLRPMGHAVTADFVSTPGWGVGSSSLADLSVDTLFIGTTAVTAYSVAGRFRTYVLVDDPQGPLSVWRDGLLSGTRIQASWVLSDAPQAIATAYTSIDGTTYVWKLRQFASAYVGSPLAIQFFQARTAAVHPAPTDGGDPVHWEPISSQVIVPPTAAPLYASQGPYTDGAMTQKATTDALGLKVNVSDAQRTNSAAYYTSPYTNTLTSYASAAAAIKAATDEGFAYNGAGSMAGTVFLNLLNDTNPITVSSACPVDSLIGTGADPVALQLAAGVRLSARSLRRVSIWNGTLVLYLNGLSQITGSTVTTMEFTAAPTGVLQTVILTDSAVAAWSNPGNSLVKIVLRGNTVIPAAPYPSNVTVVDQRNQLVDTFAVLPYPTGGAIAVDFNTATVRTIAAAGNLAYGASLNVALLRTKEHYLTNTSGAAITLSFPAGWSFFPGPAPTSLAAGKQAVLTLRSLGIDDSTIKAAWVAQA